MLFSVLLFVAAVAVAVLAHFWLHGLARHLVARALGVKGTRLPLAIADHEAYRASPLDRRLIAAAAGPVANYLLCALMFLAGTILMGGQHPTTQIERVVSGGAADQAGLRAGDRIVALAGMPVSTSEDLITTIRAWGTGSLPIEIERAGQRQSVTAEVREGRIGIMLAKEKQPVPAGGIGRALVMPAETMVQFALRFLEPSGREVTLMGPVGVTRLLATAPGAREEVGMALVALATYASLAWPLSILLAFLNNRARR